MALKGLKVIEMMGLAPGPFCGTILADFGASVTVVSKIEPLPIDVMSNGKRMLSVNLKTKDGLDILKKMCSTADIFLDTFRPGVLEKLGLDPTTLLKSNEKLIYARLTGYGQTGSFKSKGGHDINYVSMSGILSMLKKPNAEPIPPINLLGDFAGGSLCCALGILMALYNRNQTGKGQVIDCSMTEGVAYIGTWLYKSRNLPIWTGEPGKNMLDGGAPFYCTYKTKDGKYMAVGAIEPQFYENFLNGLNLSSDDYDQMSNSNINKTKFQEIFLTKSQDEWSKIFDDLDACVTPVLDMKDVSEHKLSKTRLSFYKNEDDITVPEPAPRLSDTPAISSGKKIMPKTGEHTIEILKELNYSNEKIKKLLDKGCIYAHKKSNL